MHLGFKQKLIVSPVLMAAAFALILVVNYSMGARNETRLGKIETGFVPALELFRETETSLDTIQRGLQDAVASEDVDLLSQTDLWRDEMLVRLRNSETNTVLDGAELQAVAAMVSDYYGMAREVSSVLIAGEAGPEIGTRLEEMRTSYVALKEALAEMTARYETENHDAFAEARSDSKIALVTSASITAGALLLLVMLSYGLLRGLIAPFREFSDGFERMSSGDFSARVEVASRDELGRLGTQLNEMMDYFGELAGVADAIAAGNLAVTVQPRSDKDAFGNAFKKMVLNLRSLIERIRSSSEALAASATQISASNNQLVSGAKAQNRATEETASTMVEMATQIQQLAKNSDDLSGDVDETAASISEMNTTLEQTAENAERLVSSVSETTAALDRMIEMVSGVAIQIRSVNEVSAAAVSEASGGTEKLQSSITSIDQRVDEIGKVVTVIEGIADQTNLLSLNAAIEAARAGEAGRGFSVVADEVKRLAERCVEGTREISATVDGVQKETRKAVEQNAGVLTAISEAVANASEMCSEAARVAEDHVASTKQILQTVQTMSELAIRIGGSAKENASGAGEISRSAQNMNRFVQEIAGSTGEQKRAGELVVKAIDAIAQVASQNLAGAEQMTEQAAVLEQESTELKQRVDAFQI